MKTPACAPLKHHYDECVERVHQQQEESGKAHEDCVEECKSSMPSPSLKQACANPLQSST